VFDLETGVDQVQDPQGIVEEEAEVVVELDALRDGEVEAALDMNEHHKHDIDDKLDSQRVLRPVIATRCVTGVLSGAVEHAFYEHQEHQYEEKEDLV